jgi:chromobox protein 1
VEVEAMQENGENYVYLTWRNGKKTQHPIKTAHVRCPQVMLRFYEKHLVFKQGGGKKSATPA